MQRQRNKGKCGNDIIVNDIKMVVQYINSNSRFGVSPFAIGMTHQDAALEAQLALQVALSYISDEDMDRYSCNVFRKSYYS